MLTTLFSILTTPVRTIFSTEGLPCPYCRMLQSSLEEERRLNRELLGLSQTAPTLVSRQPESLVEPDEQPLDPLEGLSPEMQEVLMREYAEEMAKYPKNQSVHPEVPQIVPGGPVNLSP